MQRGSASRGGSGPGLASRVVRHVERDSGRFVVWHVEVEPTVPRFSPNYKTNAVHSVIIQLVDVPPPPSPSLPPPPPPPLPTVIAVVATVVETTASAPRPFTGPSSPSPPSPCVSIRLAEITKANRPTIALCQRFVIVVDTSGDLWRYASPRKRLVVESSGDLMGALKRPRLYLYGFRGWMDGWMDGRSREDRFFFSLTVILKFIEIKFC